MKYARSPFMGHQRSLSILWVFVLLLFTLGASASSLTRVEDAQILKLPSAGKIVVLNFWATWCAPCRTEIPALNRLHDRYPDARFIGINVDDPENEGAIPGFLKKFPIRYEVIRRTGKDFKGTAQAIDPQWGAGIPATFVFVEGKRIFSKIGMIDEPELDGVLNRAGKP
ncbi:MAG TPA: TlpA disulfide reductase family protein [Acidobacteriota bacterium]|nr:TlpA disulfide reductase family protein [Acidobacteriota bacterium]